MSRQFGLMMETCGELCDPIFRARLNQVALGSHQRVNYNLVLSPPEKQSKRRRKGGRSAMHK